MRRAAEKASEILKTVYGKRAALPIDLSILYYRFEVQLIRVPLERLDGLLYRYRERWTMLVNSSVHPVRQRFSQAHEWGHYFLHPEIGLHLDLQGSTFYDDEANRFAEELLMPESQFRELYQRFLDADSFNIVPILASAFNVSRQAVRVRIEHLNLISGGLI